MLSHPEIRGAEEFEGIAMHGLVSHQIRMPLVCIRRFMFAYDHVSVLNYFVAYVFAGGAGNGSGMSKFRLPRSSKYM
jgi:hypothetical protein